MLTFLASGRPPAGPSSSLRPLVPAIHARRCTSSCGAVRRESGAWVNGSSYDVDRLIYRIHKRAKPESTARTDATLSGRMWARLSRFDRDVLLEEGVRWGVAQRVSHRIVVRDGVRFGQARGWQRWPGDAGLLLSASLAGYKGQLRRGRGDSNAVSASTRFRPHSQLTAYYSRFSGPT